MPQDRPAPGSPEDWLARARGDLALSSVPLSAGAFYEDLCFHAQQAAEKATNTVYRQRGLAFRYTQDLGELLAGLKDDGIDVPPDVEEAQMLTTYAWEARYPGPGEPEEEEYLRAVALAGTVVRWAEVLLAGGPS